MEMDEISRYYVQRRQERLRRSPGKPKLRRQREKEESAKKNEKLTTNMKAGTKDREHFKYKCIHQNHSEIPLHTHCDG